MTEQTRAAHPDTLKVVHDDLAVEDALGRPLGTCALIGGTWAAAMGLLAIGVPVLIGWALSAGPAGSPADALRLGVHAQLAANLVPVSTPDGAISLLPLGLVAIPILLLTLVARWAVRTARPADLPDAALLAGGISVVYALACLVAGAIGSNAAISSPGWAMFCGPLLVATLTTSIVIVRCAGLTPMLMRRVPAATGPVVAGALAALAALVAGGALIAGAALIAGFGDAMAVAERLDAGIVGGVLLTLLCLAYVPNAILWAISYAVGPGFSVGAGTIVAPSGVDTGALPAFPLLAALPADGAPPAASALLLLLPAIAGVVAGVLVVRRSAGADIAAEQHAVHGALAGVCAGVVLTALLALSGGAIGDGRLTAMGPSAWRVGLLATVALATVSAASAWAMARRHASRASR